VQKSQISPDVSIEYRVVTDRHGAIVNTAVQQCVARVTRTSLQPDQNLRGPRVARQEQLSIDICCPHPSSAANQRPLLLLSNGWDRQTDGHSTVYDIYLILRWLGSRVVSVLDSGAVGLGSNCSRDAVGLQSQANCSYPSCLCSSSSEIGSSPLNGCEGNCEPGRK